MVEFIAIFKKEAERSDKIFMRLEVNVEGKRRKKEYLKLESRIKKILKKYEESGDINAYLKAISRFKH